MAKTMLNKIVSKPESSLPLLELPEKPPFFHDFQFKRDLINISSLNHYLESHTYKIMDYLEFYRNFLLNFYFKELQIIELSPEFSRISCIKTSPNDQYLAIVNFNVFGFYNLQENRIIKPLNISGPYHNEILSICFDEDNQVFFTAGTDNNITSWDIRSFLTTKAQSSDSIHKLKVYSGHENYVSALSFSHQILASGSFDKTVRIWTNEKDSKILAKHKAEVISLSFSKNAKFLASGSIDFTIRIWNVEEGIEEKVLLEHTQELTSVSFSPLEPEKLISSALDMTVRLWDLSAKKNKVIFQGQAVENVDNARFSNDGNWIIAVIDNKTLIFWSVEREIEEKRVFIGKIGFITSLSFSKDNRILYYSDSRKIHCLKLKSLKQIQQKTIKQASSIESFFVTIKKKLVVWDQKKIYIYEPFKRNYRLITHLPQVIESNNYSLKVTIANNEEYLAFSTDYYIEIYIILQGFEKFQLMKRIPLDFSSQKKLQSLLFSNKAQYLAAAFPSKLLIFKQETFKSLSELIRIKGIPLQLPKASDQISCVAFSNNELYLAGGLTPNHLNVWTLSNNSKIKLFPSNNYSISCIRFTANDEKLITGTKENAVLIWDIRTELEEKKLTGHISKVRDLAIANNALVFASSGKDKTIRVWNIATGQEIKTYGPFNEKSQGICFSPDDKRLLACVDKTLMNFKQKSYLGYTQIKIMSEILKENEDLKLEDLIIKYPKLFTYDAIKDLVLFREIYPYNISIFHYLAYFQLERSLEIVLNLCQFYKIIPKFSFDQAIVFLNKPSQTPISIAMELNNIAIMHLFIKALKRNSLGPGCCPSITIKILSKLIEYEPSYVSELLESRFCEPYGEIPRTYWEFEEPLQASLNLMVVKENDIETNLLNKRTEAIKKTFKKTLLKNEPLHKKCKNCCKRRINLNKAVKQQSQAELIKSLEIKMLDLPGIIDPDNDENFFIKTHELDSDHPLFGSRVFLAILQYKWDTYARDYFLKDALIYFLYLIILVVNSLYFFPKRLINFHETILDFQHISNILAVILDGILGVFFLFFLSKELFSIHKLRWHYFLDLDNYMDIPALIFLAILIIHDLGNIFGFLNSNTFDMRIYHSVTLFLASLRFLSFARGFEAMAFMIRLIIQVTIDMSYFLIIMFFITCSLAFSAFLLQNKTDFTIFEAFNAFYRLILGDFSGFDEISENSVAFSLVWAGFLIGTLIIMIVMLNLLISIISDTYGKVSGMNILANSYEKTGIIIEIDKKLDQKKKMKLRMKGFFQKYLYVAYCKDLKDNEDKEEGDFGGRRDDGNSFEEKKEIKEILGGLESIEREIHKLASFNAQFEEFSQRCLKNQEMLNKKINRILEGTGVLNKKTKT